MQEKSNKLGLKQWALIVSVLCLLLVTVSGVYAFLSATSQSLTNRFLPVEVTCQVKENFDGQVKSNVRICNTGDVDAYIRAAVIVNWVNAEGKLLATAPVAGTDYNVVWGDTGWVQDTAGFWYHQAAVAVDDATAVLIQSISPVHDEVPEGYFLQVQILASAIQADPAKAANEAWGIHVS